MSCCGNNKINELKQIYNIQPIGSNTSTVKPVIGKGSPFSNYSVDYKPIMSPNGKFVKYVRESKKEI